jgi:hypothetical protein
MSTKLAAVAAAAALALGGCGEDEPPGPSPSGPLADALAATGGAGGASGSLGVGWADPRLAERIGAGPRLIGEALGPNARSVVEAAPVIRRRFGFDPLAAERLISVGGSYAFGLRLDGVDGGGLARALADAGGRTRPGGGAELLEIGDYAVVPEPLLRAGVLGLGAFDAFSRRLVVLAISDRARAALLGRGGRLLDEPTYRAAADCLEGTVVARMIPDKLLLSNEQGVELLAAGITSEGEVLCVIGGSPERSAEVAAALETSLAAGARDPGSGRQIGDSVASAEVERCPYDGVEAVRAELRLARGEPRGYLFGAIANGSLIGLINASTETFSR